MMFREPTSALEALRDAIQQSGVPIRKLDAASRLKACEGVELEVLHPPGRGVRGSDNANSIVLKIKFEGQTILLPGDLETPGLEDVMAESPLDCEIVMAPHHGSLRSDPLGFSAWTTPEHVVISGGPGRDIGAVRWAYEYGGAEVAHTAIDGAVRFEVTADGISTSRFMQRSNSQTLKTR